MFVQKIPKKTKDKTYYSYILTESYREDGKIKHRNISNISNWPINVIEDFANMLKGQKVTDISSMNQRNGKSFGALQVVLEVAKILGITKSLGTSIEAKYALLQIAGRIISQGSKNYIANEWSKNQAVEKLLNIKDFNHNNLYDNLDWLADKQDIIETKIFKHRYQNQEVKKMFLYDVTSSYMEGTKNELATYGYNRDKKKGKMQIVIGLLTDSYGYPITIEVFHGNTNDTKTVSSQLQKLKTNFGVKDVIFVGDKGMIKETQIQEIISENYKWNYLTTITKEQINSLLKADVIQLSMFDNELVEIEHDANRYILRKNSVRAEHIKLERENKIKYIESLILKSNTYLSEHLKAKPAVQISKLQNRISALKLSQILSISELNRTITISIDEEQKKEFSKLDGCYVVKTNASKEILSKKEAHDRYKDLAEVEFAFRTMKTTMEEIRPIFVRTEQHTKGHVFVVMLSYMILKWINDKTKELPFTRKGIIEHLDKIQYITYDYNGNEISKCPTRFTKEQQEILDAMGISLNKSSS